jgi:hypothetical protein
VTVIWSHQRTCVFGTITFDGKHFSGSLMSLTNIHFRYVNKQKKLYYDVFVEKCFIIYIYVLVLIESAMSQTGDELTMAETVIKERLSRLKAEHPILAAASEKIQSMDEAQTLKALIGVHLLERILLAHGRNIVEKKVVS